MLGFIVYICRAVTSYGTVRFYVGFTELRKGEDRFMAEGRGEDPRDGQAAAQAVSEPHAFGLHVPNLMPLDYTWRLLGARLAGKF
jgi:hypothetical protein